MKNIFNISHYKFVSIFYALFNIEKQIKIFLKNNNNLCNNFTFTPIKKLQNNAQRIYFSGKKKMRESR